MNTYHPQTAKFLATVAQNMPEIPGEKMQSWIENPVALGEALEEVLLGPWFSVWMTLKLGPGFNADDFRKAMEGNGMKITFQANEILNTPMITGTSEVTMVTEGTEIDLVLVTVAELGFKSGATRQDIYKRAQELGLELCPAAVALELRLQYNNQPCRCGPVLIAMYPVSTETDQEIFCMEHGNTGLRLNSTHGDSHHHWDAFCRWVFVRPRK